jgi:heterodisulfide reductase subunit B
MDNIQTVLDAGGEIIAHACSSCEIEIEEGQEIVTDLGPEKLSRFEPHCFKCGKPLD